MGRLESSPLIGWVMYDCAIIGGGVVGLATAVELGRRNPAAKIVLLEKEENFAEHQSGRNSGVIHSGIYYKPGSFKARFARAGSQSMVAFCQKYDIPHEVCGTVIVAVAEKELPRRAALFERGLEKQFNVEKL